MVDGINEDDLEYAKKLIENKQFKNYLGEEHYEFYKQRWQGVLDSIKLTLTKGDKTDEQS